jgi:hypothetical protein
MGLSAGALSFLFASRVESTLHRERDVGARKQRGSSEASPPTKLSRLACLHRASDEQYEKHAALLTRQQSCGRVTATTGAKRASAEPRRLTRTMDSQRYIKLAIISTRPRNQPSHSSLSNTPCDSITEFASAMAEKCHWHARRDALFDPVIIACTAHPPRSLFPLGACYRTPCVLEEHLLALPRLHWFSRGPRSEFECSKFLLCKEPRSSTLCHPG